MVSSRLRRRRPQASKLVLTPRGWLFAGAAVVLLVAARVIGVVELAVLAAAAFLAVVVAVLRVRSRSVQLEAERVLRPDRVAAGTPAWASLGVSNLGSRTTRVLTATDAFGGDRRVARFLIPPLPSAERAEAEYQLPTERRGIYDVGPLSVAIGDPLGMAEARVTVAGVDRLVVYPRVEEIRPLLGSASRGVRLGSSKPVRARTGTDFFGLREYEVGDDLRRVHWPSTARTGNLMLRQDEISWESETTTVLLDTRWTSHSEASFERAVEVAASIVTTLCRGRIRLRFLTTEGFEMRSAGRERYFAIMEFLAGVARGPATRFSTVVDDLRKRREGGPLAVVTADLAPSDVTVLGALALRYDPMVVVVLRPSATGGIDAGRTPSMPGTVVVPVSDSLPFVMGWDQAVTQCQRKVPATF